MSFKPNCAASSVGSLPHLDPVAACELVLRECPEIPAWPQLPNLSFRESMYVQYAYDLPGIVLDDVQEQIYVDIDRLDPVGLQEFLLNVENEDVDYFAYEQDYFAGLFEMLKLAKDRKDIKLLKGQVTGPVSLGLKITDKDKQAIVYDETLADIYVKYLRMEAKWQQKALEEVFSETLMVFDEPYMNMFGSAFLSMGKEEVLDLIKGVTDGIPGLLGVHCCGNTDWGLMIETGVDVLSLDAYTAGEALALYPDDVGGFLDKGGIIAWGIVPSIPDDFSKETREQLLVKLEKTMGLLAKKGIEQDAMLKQSIITPSCGLGPSDEPMAEEALKVTKWISDSLRKKYDLEV
jgi:methionine synthase II (cobalamin-independent)